MARAQTDVRRATMEPCVKMVSYCELQLKFILRRWCGSLVSQSSCYHNTEYAVVLLQR